MGRGRDPLKRRGMRVEGEKHVPGSNRDKRHVWSVGGNVGVEWMSIGRCGRNRRERRIHSLPLFGEG